MKKRFISWLKRVVTPDIKAAVSKVFWALASKHGIAAVAEDARKIGVNAIGIGLVGVVVDSASIPRTAALMVFIAGVIIWLGGWLLTCTQPQDKE